VLDEPPGVEIRLRKDLLILVNKSLGITAAGGIDDDSESSNIAL